MKTLRQLWPTVTAAYADIPVSAVVLDSRQVRSGMLFVAMKGLRQDGRDHIADAIASGAAAIFADKDEQWPSDTVINGIPVITIANLAHEIGDIAARFFDTPSHALQVIATTGTNGKTSVSNLLAGALTALKRKTAVLGTLGNGIWGDLQASTHTTLDAVHLQAMLSQFVQEGVSHVAMEASSHGLEQGRLNGTQIAVAVFTNLTRDHLDYHGTMENYAAAKEILFRWPTLKAAVLNADDPVSQRFQKVLANSVNMLRYSQRPDSDAEIRALQVIPSIKGLFVRVETPAGECTLDVPLLGRFNVSNLLAVLAALLAVGIPLADAVDALRHAQPVTGRMDCLMGEHPTVVVDYAHTPDALEKVLSSLREHVEGRLLCVFGCGGDRDTGKRPVMGRIAADLADQVFLTSDNPRSENPEAILADIRAGIPEGKVIHVEVDRRQAILQAVAEAKAKDIVLVAGKGHEDYQEIAGQRFPFSDLQEVRAALSSWRAA